MLEGEGAKHLDAVLKDTAQSSRSAASGRSSASSSGVDTLGEGGGGKVYRAIDLRDGQEVAVKEVSLAAYGETRRKQIVELVTK